MMCQFGEGGLVFSLLLLAILFYVCTCIVHGIWGIRKQL